MHKVQIRKQHVEYVKIGAAGEPTLQDIIRLTVASIKDKTKLQQWTTRICAKATETPSFYLATIHHSDTLRISHLVLC